MDDHTYVLKYTEMFPFDFDNSAYQTEDIKPFEVKVCIVIKLIT